MASKKLKEALRKSLKELDELSKSLEEEEDEEKKVEIQKSITDCLETSKTNRETLAVEVAQDREKKAAFDLLAESDALEAPVNLQKDIDLSSTASPGKVAAEPFDARKQASLEEDIFIEFIQKGADRISPSRRNVLHPSSARQKNWSEEAIDAGIRIPHSILAKAFPGLFMTKALPMLSTDGDAAGGRENLVFPEYFPDLLQLPPDRPSLWQRVTKKTTKTGTMRYPRLTQVDSNELGGVVVTRGTEGDDATDTEADFSQESINTYQLDAYTTLSRTLIRRSAIDIQAELITLLRNALIAVWDAEIMTGSGTEEALGIVNTTNIREVHRAVANQVSWADLVNLQFAVKDAHVSGANFIISRTVHQLLMGQLDDYGRPLFTPSTAQGLLDRLAGIPFFEAYRAQTLGNEGDTIFGNLMHYWHVVEEDMVISRSEHVEFKKGLVAFRLEAYSGGELIQPRAFSMLTDPSS